MNLIPLYQIAALTAGSGNCSAHAVLFTRKPPARRPPKLVVVP